MIEKTIYIQGISRERILELIKRSTDYFVSYTRYHKRTSGTINSIGTFYLLKVGWTTTSYYKKKNKGTNRSEGWSSLIHVFDAIHGIEITTILLLVVFSFMAIFLMSLAIVWIIGTVFTFGSYRYRKDKYILEIVGEDYEKIKSFTNRLIKNIVREHGFITPIHQDDVDKNVYIMVKELEKSYRYFNKGRLILEIAVFFGLVCELIKFAVEFSNIYTFPSEIVWYLWRFPTLLIALIGLIIMIIGETKIRKVKL
ncbi:MAG: hypothetical protein J7L07_09265 [Candidatus Odinarchaeota archaeon]|nr:hypothetical protein [Candidatus Odinarchaeota archaeon]